jgi:uncharacterized protein (DUF1684 family)
MSDIDHSNPQQYIAEVTEFRRQKDDFFGSSPQSPVPDDEQPAFQGLKYFPPDVTFRVSADLTTFDTPDVVRMAATKGDIRRYLRYAELRFTIIGQDLRLIGYKEHADDPELFIPFKDATSGGETYGAGRYLEAEDEPDEPSPREVTLDFNLAYSPWCAYNLDYSCPIPPAENTLAFPITAGELNYPVDH